MRLPSGSDDDSAHARPGAPGDPYARLEGGHLHPRAGRPRPRGAARHDAFTEPWYPVYERGALFAGAEPLGCRSRRTAAPRPRRRRLERGALVWVNYPNNPTGASGAGRLLRRGRAAPRHGFVLASDEAYTELWCDEPPSALQPDWTNLVVFNTLSKRSSMTGYRSGFAAGDRARGRAPEIPAESGDAPQEFVQRASVVAWSDEKHVERRARALPRKRALLIGVVRAQGHSGRRPERHDVRVVRRPRRRRRRRRSRPACSSTASSSHPGSYLGPSGEGYARIALVQTEDVCARAVEILEGIL